VVLAGRYFSDSLQWELATIQSQLVFTCEGGGSLKSEKESFVRDSWSHVAVTVDAGNADDVKGN
jgi:hypothetical protein